MSIFQSYILYYFIVFFTSLIVFLSGLLKQAKVSNSLTKLIFWSALILPVAFSGLRYGIGTDFFNYTDIYYRLTSSGNFINHFVNTRFEPGWILLNQIVKLIFNDVQYLFIITSLLIWIFNFKAIYDNRNKMSIAIAMFILLSTLYNPSFNTIRQSLAASVLMLAIKPILEKRPIKFYLIILFAISFHYTAIVFLPAYWITNSRIKNVTFLKNISVIVGTILFVILTPKLLTFVTSFDSLSYYSHYELEFENFGIGKIIIKLPIIIIIIFNLKRFKNNSPMSKLIIFYFIGIILEYYSYFASYVNRIAIYYEMIQIFILAAIVKVQTNKYEKLLYSAIIVIYFTSWFTYNYIYLNRHQTIPYIWDL